MAKVTIGGNDYEVGALNFKAIKRVWPRLSKAAEKANSGEPLSTEDGLESVDVAIEVIAAAFEKTHPDHDVTWIEENLTGHELAGIQIAVQEIMVESGLMQKVDAPGEAETPKKKASSTGTGTA